jgi:hypothetical protein
VLRACLAKANCTINVKSATFGGNPCGSNATNYFTARVTCRVTTVIGYQNARVVLPLQVGYPNRISPYFKSLVARMQVDGYIDDVVVVCFSCFTPMSIHSSLGTYADLQCTCDWVEVDQRLVLCSFPAVHATHGAARPAWRYDV